MRTSDHPEPTTAQPTPALTRDARWPLHEHVWASQMFQQCWTSPAWAGPTSADGYRTKGGTGVPVRTLVQ